MGMFHQSWRTSCLLIDIVPIIRQNVLCYVRYAYYHYHTVVSNMVHTEINGQGSRYSMFLCLTNPMKRLTNNALVLLSMVSN